MHLWYVECADRACRAPIGSFEHVFWWSLRMEMSRDDMVEQWARKPAEAFESWMLYLEFKWDQLEDARQSRGEV